MRTIARYDAPIKLNEMLSREIKIAVLAAIEAGQRVMDIYQRDSDLMGIEYKADNSPLTLADKASHEAIVNMLNEHLQMENYPILSEEGRDIPYEERKEWRQLWIIDPLDGTKEFIKKNGEFTVNIALVEDNEPIMGVVYAPVKGWLYYGERDNGAFMATVLTEDISDKITFEEIHAQAAQLPTDESNREKFVVVASRSHMNDETRAIVEQYQERYGELELVSIGSSLKISLLAEGKADLYPRFAPTCEWDTAAGDAVARAAGATLINVETNLPLTYNKPSLLNPYFIGHGNRGGN